MREDKAITLIALMITIIVLLIIAGVSISFLVGDNGILSKSSNAKNEYNESQIIEKWGILKSEYKIAEDTKQNQIDVNYIRQQLENSGLIFTDIEWNRFLAGESKQIGNSTINISEMPDINKNAQSITLTTGNDITLNSGSYIINSVTNVSNTSIIIPSTEVVELVINSSVAIDDKAYAKSAIDVRGTLNLYINSSTNLYSGNGINGNSPTYGTWPDRVVRDGGNGGNGAYAGINVPVGSTINIYGSGDIYAYGGNASNGAIGTGAGRWSEAVGAGAGIGGGRWPEVELAGGWETSGNRGYGGTGGANAYNLLSSGAIGISAGSTVNCHAALVPSSYGGGTGGGYYYDPTALTGYKGGDGTRGAYGRSEVAGATGESAGNIYIYNSKVHAYGGNAGTTTTTTCTSGSGGARLSSSRNWRSEELAGGGSAAANGSGGGGYIG